MYKYMVAFALVFCLPFMAIGAEKEADKTESSVNSADMRDSAQEKKEPENIFSCKYYTVTLPDNWQAIVKPTEEQGTVNAIFATSTGSSVITMVAAPNGGADIKTIADLFADQLKATRQPVLKQGQYVFSFPLQNGVAQAVVANVGDDFMVSTIAGNQKDAMTFIRNNIKSENWKDLLPK